MLPLRSLPFGKLAVVFSLALGLGVASVACSSPSLGSLPENQLELETSKTENDGAGGAGGGPGLSVIDCHPTDQVKGSWGSCLPLDSKNDCQLCVQSNCCAEQQACNATAPDSACSYGSTLFEARVVEGGEIGCMMECFAAREESGEFAGTEADISACSAHCGASECQAQAARAPTIALAECILGTSPGMNGCLAECGFAE